MGLGPLMESPHFSNGVRLWAALGYLALFATLLAFGIQTWAQKVISPVRVALISSLEPVFAALWAALLLGERLTARELVGGGLIVVGVLVGHTHFDHAVDAPAICRRFGCRAYGSDSLVRLMALHGLAEQAVEVEPYEAYELGPFTVSFTPSLHSKLVLGLAVPFDGELTCDHLDGLSPNAYRSGPVRGIQLDVAVVSFYHQGSANLIEDATRAPGVDFVLAGVPGRGFTSAY